MINRNQKKLRIVLIAVFFGLLQACTSTAQQGPTSEEKEQSLVGTYVVTAGIYLKRGQLNFAKEKLDKALALNPDDTNANNVMGLYQWRIGQYKEADKYFRRAIDSAPENPESLNNYAVFLCEQGKVKNAVKYFDRAVQVPVYPAKVQAYINAGRCLGDDKQFSIAEKYYEHALKLNPYSPEALKQMAKITARSGRLLSARKFITSYFFKGSKTAETVYLAMRIEETIGNKKMASQYARTLKKSFPNSQEAIWVKNRSQKKR